VELGGFSRRFRDKKASSGNAPDALFRGAARLIGEGKGVAIDGGAECRFRIATGLPALE